MDRGRRGIKTLGLKECLLKYLVLIFLWLQSSAWATTYYMSTTGNDEASGVTAETAWATFAHAYGVLQAGDTLIVRDGTYNEALSPTCSGSLGSPITFQAENRGMAIIQMTSGNPGSAIEISSTTSYTRSYITIDGFIARSWGEHSAIYIYSEDDVNESQMTNNITVRNTGAFGSSNQTNCDTIDLGNNLRDSLFEDIWAYGFGRKSLSAFGCLRITIRRAVLRYDYWEGGEYLENDPRGSFDGYNTTNSVFENIILLDSAPDPPDTTPDRAAFSASGNETPAGVEASSGNKYLGFVALNNYGNGLECNGGSGDPNTNLYFKDLIIWDCLNGGGGVYVSNNTDGATFLNITCGESGYTGFTVNSSPTSPIDDISISTTFVTQSAGYAFSYSAGDVPTFANNSATLNDEGSDLNAEYAPTLTYIVNPTMVSGHERGATVMKRYVDGVITTTDLWPYPNEDLIKQCMCNSTDLTTVNRIAANGENWEPSWCATSKTLTTFIWEYLGNAIPSSIYGTTATKTQLVGSSISGVSLQ